MGWIRKEAFMEDESKHVFQNVMNMCNRDAAWVQTFIPLLSSGTSGNIGEQVAQAPQGHLHWAEEPFGENVTLWLYLAN